MTTTAPNDAASSNGADPDVATYFLRFLYPEGPWAILVISVSGKIEGRTFTPDEAEAARRYIAEHNGRSNLYFSINRVRGLPKKKVGKDDIVALHFLQVDIDLEDQNIDWSDAPAVDTAKDHALKRLSAYDPPPTAIVSTGGGYQGIWRLAEPVIVNGNKALMEPVENRNKYILHALGGDKSGLNADRIFRLPGTINVFSRIKFARGRRPAATALVEHHAARVYNLDRFPEKDPARETFADEAEASSGAGDASPKNAGSPDMDGLPLPLIRLVRDGVEVGRRSEQFHRAVCWLKDLGWSIEKIEELLFANSYGIAAKYDGRLRSEIERSFDKSSTASGGSDFGAGGGGTANDAEGIGLEDFHAYMPLHSYIFAPTREMWPASSVNSRIPPVAILEASGTPKLSKNGNEILVKASDWLDQHRPVEQMTWVPGQPMLIKDRLVSDGGWIEFRGCTTFNLYRPPTIVSGDAREAGRWLDHIHRVYPDDAEHIVIWLAHRVQKPHEKINHALVLGGAQGVGKDTILEPVKRAVGPWNFIEVSPQQVLGRFNGHIKSVVLRVSEARDLGDVDRYGFYDHMKVLTAAPPDVLRVDEKHLREYAVFNVCGVIITSNHKMNGIYLPADDRRHYVAWTDRTKEDFDEKYWNEIYAWYDNGGAEHVAAYLAGVDLSAFNPKAPPPKTPAFWDIVDSSRAPEDDELADALDRLANPDATTLEKISHFAAPGLVGWLGDRKNSRQIPYRMETVGYVAVRNPAAKDGRWKVRDSRRVVYAKTELAVPDRLRVASAFVERHRH